MNAALDAEEQAVPLDPIIKIRDVGRSFPGPPQVEALRRANLTIHEGDHVAILGPSGSGKSTLLNILGLLDTASTGSYVLNSIDTASLSERERSGRRASEIGFVFQSFHLLPDRTAIENVMMADLYLPARRSVRRQAALDALGRVGLGHRVHASPSTLSGGERQRVAIARALAGSPRLVLADEPTGNLDSDTSNEILDLLDELNRSGVTLAVITHDQDVAARARRRVTIRDGELTEFLPPVEQRTQYAESANGSTSDVRSGLSLRALISEALSSLSARLGRTLLTSVGTILGVAALVATVGLTMTAGSQIVARFDELEATSVTVEPRALGVGGEDGSIGVGSKIPFDVEDRLDRLNGVVASGTQSEIGLEGTFVRSLPINDPTGQNAWQLPMYAASAGLFDAVRSELLAGRFFDRGHDERGDNVAVLGPAAAQRLGISRLGGSPSIFVGQDALTVIGILSSVERSPELLNSIIVTQGYGRRQFGLESPDKVQIDVEVGAAVLIGSQAAVALSPNDPGALRVSVPPSPTGIRDDVESDVGALFLVLGGVSLLVGALGIASVTLVAVLERRAEIGLRRALGARKIHVATQFLTESAFIGAFAGVIGTSVGIVTVVVVAADRDWTPLLANWLAIAAPVAATLVGLFAGLYPALRAASVEPIEALRE